MSTSAPNEVFEDFVALVRRNLERNGFPGNAVSLPLERMYEEADKRGFSFNKVREALAREGVQSNLTDARVVFSLHREEDEHPADADLFAAAQNMFARMSPAEREELAQMMGRLDPEELARMQREFDALPAEEKARLQARLNVSL